MNANFDEFRTGCTLLSTMVAHGRVEAGVFLLGLLRYFDGDLNALGVVVENVGGFQNAQCAAALFAELRRLPSSNTTRRYLDSVISTLVRFSADMVQESFWELSRDSAFSYKMARSSRRRRRAMRTLGDSHLDGWTCGRPTTRCTRPAPVVS